MRAVAGPGGWKLCVCRVGGVINFTMFISDRLKNLSFPTVHMIFSLFHVCFFPSHISMYFLPYILQNHDHWSV